MMSFKQGLDFKDVEGSKVRAEGESLGGPIALVTFRWLETGSSVRARLDLEKLAFIDPLPASIAKQVREKVQSLAKSVVAAEAALTT
jgi:hypothetical protein